MHQDATWYGCRPQPSGLVLDGDLVPLPKKGPPNFRPMFIVAIRLDGSRCHLARRWPQPRRLCVRWGPSPPLHKGGGAPSPIFGPFLLWPNGWMHQDATWYGGSPQPRGLWVRWGPILPFQKGGGGGGRRQSPPNFQPMAIVAGWLDGSRWHMAWR